MISVEDREKIRRAYFVEHKSLRQIAKELHVACMTISKAIGSAEAETYQLSVPRTAPRLGPYQSRIDELLAENEHLPPKQRYTSHKIYQEGDASTREATRACLSRGRFGIGFNPRLHEGGDRNIL